VPIEFACFCSANGFISSDNGGDGKTEVLPPFFVSKNG